MIVAENPSATLHKISELYDRIAFAAVGKYNEFENFRKAGVRLADLTGYTYGREDVTAKSVANAYAQALGAIFTEQMKPFEIEILVAQVGETQEADEMYRVLYDGSLQDEHGAMAMGGHADTLMGCTERRLPARHGPGGRGAPRGQGARRCRPEPGARRAGPRGRDAGSRAPAARVPQAGRRGSRGAAAGLMSDDQPGYWSDPARGGPRSNAGVVALALGLIASLAMNLVMAVRLDEERRNAEDLKAALVAQQEQIDRLKDELGREGGDDPLAAIRAAVARIRDLRFKRDVATRVLTVRQLRHRVDRLFRKENARREIAQTQAVLEAIGVVPAGIDLYDMILAAQTEQVAGYYDPKAKRMFVGARDVRDPTPGDRLILAHEYTHAVTDQQLGLDRLEQLAEGGDDDATTAYQCLTEGDAQLVATLYAADVLTPAEIAALQSTDIQTEAYDRLPAFLRTGLIAPYVEGQTFVQALFNRGGWDLVNDAYADPPDSTEQVLHPELYIDDRDAPSRVRMPDLGGIDASWDRIDRGSVGELDLRLIADLPAVGGGLSGRDARAAADGWDGGTYLAWSSDEGTLVAMLTTWDSESEAREAQSQFGSWLPLRYGNVGTSRDVGPRGRGWTSPDGAGTVIRSGTQVLFLFGPDARSVDDAQAEFGGF